MQRFTNQYNIHNFKLLWKSIQSCGLYPKCGYFLTKLYIHQKNFQIKITNITYGFISLSSTLTRPLPFHPMQKIQQERKTTFQTYSVIQDNSQTSTLIMIHGTKNPFLYFLMNLLLFLNATF